jgi:hypothetical protein
MKVGENGACVAFGSTVGVILGSGVFDDVAVGRGVWVSVGVAVLISAVAVHVGGRYTAAVLVLVASCRRGFSVGGGKGLNGRSGFRKMTA